MLALIAMGVSIDYMAHSGRAYFSLSAEYSDPEKARAETMTEVRYSLSHKFGIMERSKNIETCNWTRK